MTATAKTIGDLLTPGANAHPRIKAQFTALSWIFERDNLDKLSLHYFRQRQLIQEPGGTRFYLIKEVGATVSTPQDFKDADKIHLDDMGLRRAQILQKMLRDTDTTNTGPLLVFQIRKFRRSKIVTL